MTAYNFDCLIYAEGLLKVTVSHVRCKSGNIPETVQTTIGSDIYGLSDSVISDDFEWSSSDFFV